MLVQWKRLTMDNVIIASAIELLLDSDEDRDVELLLKISNERKKKSMRIKNYVPNVALLYSLDDFKSHFRLRRDTFEHLLETIAPFLKNPNIHGVGRPSIAPECQLLIALSMLSNQEVYRLLSEKFDVSKSTAWVHTHNICKILSNLASTYIFWPNENIRPQIMGKFEQKKGLINVLGAIDGTHIPIACPVKKQRAFYNHKKFHSLILQGVCDADNIFIDIFTGFPGSMHDSRVFQNSDLGKKMLENADELFPANSHLLGDSAYSNSTYMLTPFRDNGRLTRTQLNYNYIHSATRIVIEQTFGLLKGRFRILKFVNCYKTGLIPHIIVACCVLHNICMKRDDDVEPDMEEVDLNRNRAGSIDERDTNTDKRNLIANFLMKKKHSNAN